MEPDELEVAVPDDEPAEDELVAGPEKPELEELELEELEAEEALLELAEVALVEEEEEEEVELDRVDEEEVAASLGEEERLAAPVELLVDELDRPEEELFTVTARLVPTPVDVAGVATPLDACVELEGEDEHAQAATARLSTKGTRMRSRSGEFPHFTPRTLALFSGEAAPKGWRLGVPRLRWR
jgi:hypothetical protein